MVWNISR